MVTVTDFYVLKFQYQAEDAQTGDMKKQKQEILAECANYTDAEKLAYALIHDEQWDKYQPVKPEIVRLKINDLHTNDCIIAEPDLFDGFAEMYLESQEFHFYQINLDDPYTDENGKEKKNKISMFIPAATTGEAEAYAKRLYEDATITATKIMAFTSAFVLPSTLESIRREYANM